MVKIEAKIPNGIKYVVGNESWLPEADRTPLRLIIEEWGNLGPMELNPEIEPNQAGFRVRHTEILAPPGMADFTRQVDGYYWLTEDEARASATARPVPDKATTARPAPAGTSESEVKQ